MLNPTLFKSEDHTWETPQHLFDTLHEVFSFTLDVCAVPETAKCETYFTPETDGLSQAWTGTCWMNPPYGRFQTEWLKKASHEFFLHNSTIVCLIPARPDTKIWQDVLFQQAHTITFIKGRLKFGEATAAAPFPSALVVFTDVLTKAQYETLSSLGKTFSKQVVFQ